MTATQHIGFRAGQTVKAICPDNRRRYCRIEKCLIQPADGKLVNVLLLQCPGFQMFRRLTSDVLPAEHWAHVGDPA